MKSREVCMEERGMESEGMGHCGAAERYIGFEPVERELRREEMKVG